MQLLLHFILKTGIIYKIFIKNNVMEKSNSVNTSEQDKKKSQAELKYEFLDEFARENNTPDIVSLIARDNIIGKDLREKMGKFKELNKSMYGNLELNNINTSDGINIDSLKAAFWKDIVKLKTAKNLFYSEVKKVFVIKDDKLLEKIIENQKSISDLYKYINSPKELVNFIKKEIPGVEKIKTLELFSSINPIDKNEVKLRYSKITSEDEKREIEEILSRIAINDIRDDDIRWLFQFDFLTIPEKKNIIESYIPTISLRRAEKIWLLTESEAIQKRKYIMTASFKEIFTDVILDEIILEDIINNTSFDDIILKTKDFYTNLPLNLSEKDKYKLIKKNINLLAENEWFKNLEKEVKLLNEDVKNKIKIKWPQSLEDLVVGLEEINTGERFKKLGNFKVGNIVKYISKDSEGKPTVTYIKILRDNKDNNEFEFEVIWIWNHISLKNTSDSIENKSYVDFIEWLKEKKYVEFECFTVKEIEKQIEEDTLIKSEYNSVDYGKLDATKKDFLKNKYIWKLNDDIVNLEDEIKKSDDENIKKSKQKLLDQKNEILGLYKEGVKGGDNDIKLSSVFNKLIFIEKLDEIDPDWKSIWFGEWTLFQVGKSVYEVVKFGDEITIKYTKTGRIEGDPIDLESFYLTFKEKKAERIEKIDNFSSLIEKSLNDSNNKGHENWKDHEIKDWELVAKWVTSWDKTWDQVVEYLVWGKTNSIIKINSINWNRVTIQFWERKNFSDFSDDEKKANKIKKDTKWERISLDNREFNISLNDLNNLIKEDNLYPDWKTWKTHEPEKVKGLENDFHRSIISQIFRRTSFKELVMWWKMLLDWIEETFKKWNDLHAAEFAMRLWNFLPGDLSQDMMIKVERAQQEQQDKELENLWKVDSPIAVKRIKKWLLNKDTPEYKKEAAILFMLEKYGHLTAKQELYAYRWKWLWYEALGWRINDELFIDEKKKAEESNITFSEEYLVHILLKRQCSWRLPPKRRSRLHKEYENKWKSWVKAEFDKWYSDAEKKRTAADIAKWWHGEADTWTTSNAIWWYKKAVERWGSLEDMSEWFFALLYSWSLYDIDQVTFIQLKNLWDNDWMPMIMTRFSTTKSDMILFNKTVLKICEHIEKSKYPEHKWILKEAQDLFNDALSWKWSEAERFKRSVNFWKKHWTPVVRALNMANVEDTKYSKTDKIILFEKEKDPVFKNYYKLVRGYTSMTNTFWQGFMDEECWEEWVTWLNINEVTKKYLLLTTSMAFRHEKTWGRVWDEISKDIKSTRNKKFVLDDNDKVWNTKKQQEYLVHVLRDVTSGILSVTWKWRMSPYNSNSSNIWKDFNNWKLNFENDLWNFSPEDILKGEADKLLLRTADNILKWKWTNENWIANPLDELTASTKKSADTTLWQQIY